MPIDYANQPPTSVRRTDREVTDESWIRAFLREAPVGFLASVHDGQPYLNSNLFVFDEQRHALYMHTASVGRTQTNLALDAKVCFSAASMGRLLPAKEALQFSVEYASVVVFGRALRVVDPIEATDALQQLLDKYAPHLLSGRDYRPITPDELQRTGVIRIDIDDWSGKKKEVGADFPGAFNYVQPGTESV